MNEERDTSDSGALDDDTPGDPACWLKRVCPRCGTLAAADPPTTCPQCHAVLPGE